MAVPSTDRRFLVPSLTILVCLSAFTVDVCIPAFSAISRDFAVASGDTHFIISAYVIGMAIVQIPLGFLSERIGRVNTLYVGLVIFAIGSLITTFSNSLPILLFGRFIQGIGGAAGPVITRAIARDIAEGVELNRLMALLVSALAVSTILAPILGSLLMAVFPWPSVFAISLLMGFVCLLLVRYFVPETRNEALSSKAKFRAHWRLFWTHRPAVVGTLMIALLFAGYMSFVASFSTIAADQFGQKASAVGWYFAAFIAFFLLGSNIVRRWAAKVKKSVFMDAGSACLFISILLFGWLLLDPDQYMAGLFGLAVFLLSMGMLFGALGAMVLSSLPQIAGTASGIMGTAQMLAAFVGSTISALLYQGNFSSTVQILSVSAILLILIYLGNRRFIF